MNKQYMKEVQKRKKASLIKYNGHRQEKRQRLYGSKNKEKRDQDGFWGFHVTIMYQRTRLQYLGETIIYYILTKTKNSS